LERRVSDIAPEYPAETWNDYWNMIKGKGYHEIETQHQGSDGVRHAVSIQIHFVDNEEEPLLVATSRDISERKRQEQELARIREQLQLAMTGGNVGLWDWDIVGEDVYYSPEFHDQLGEPRETLSGLEDWRSRLHPDDLEQALKRVEEQFEGRYGDSEYEQTFRMRHADGNYRWIRSLGQLLRDLQGNPLRMIGVHVDVTENHELLERVRSAYRELDSFTYIASHDLKAPLRAIDNLSSWIAADLEDQLPEKSAEHLSILRQRTRRMELLLNDLLEYSRVGRSKFHAEEVDTDQLVKDAFELVAPAEGFRLTTSELPVFDTVRPPLELCLRNLIDNAIKHHDRGEGNITVGCEVQTHYYRFSVSDDGAGIPEEFHDRIFGMFLSLKPRDEVEGSGI
ncbi:MAG: PAS domain-containing protein, partial [Lacipirellulaceae bacterium]